MSERTSRRKALRDSIGPAFRALVDEVIPLGLGARAVAAARGISAEDPARPMVGKSSAELRYLNKLKDSGISQPSASKAWEIAEFAQALAPDRNAWCFGLLFVFAAGHFGEFARTMTATDGNLLPRHRKFALTESARSAVEPTGDSGLTTLRERLALAGVPDTVAHSELRRVRSHLASLVRPDRNVWILALEERAALRTAFLSGASSHGAAYKVAVATATLAASAPDLGIEMQRDITVTALCHAFRP